MTCQNLLIYGAGLLGHQIARTIDAHFSDQYALIGFVDDNPDKHHADVFKGVRCVGSLADVATQEAYEPTRCQLVLAIGYQQMQTRRHAYEQAKQLGYQFVAIVHPRASVEPDVELGEGTLIMAGAVVDKGSYVGSINYLDIGCLVAEDVRLDDNNYLAAGVVVGGNACIGRDNFIGLNSTLVDEVVVGSHNFINAHSLVYKNIKDNSRLVVMHEQHLIPGAPV